jgi:hypothetical protein
MPHRAKPPQMVALVVALREIEREELEYLAKEIMVAQALLGQKVNNLVAAAVVLMQRVEHREIVTAPLAVLVELEERHL